MRREVRITMQTAINAVRILRERGHDKHVWMCRRRGGACVVRNCICPCHEQAARVETTE